MTEPVDDRYAQADTSPTEHEEEVADVEEDRGDNRDDTSAYEQATEASGTTADADLAADQRPGDASTP